MWVVDAHQDLAYNALGYYRDYRQSVLATRAREGVVDATVGLPDALLGRVALVCATLFVAPQGKLWDVPGADLTYSDARQAFQKAQLQLDYYQRLSDEDRRIRLVRTSADLDAVLATWAEDVPLNQRQQGLVILMEGADPILEPKQFEEWYARGVRIVGTAWGATRYSGGTGAPGGLTRLGDELLEILASFNALLDLAHMAEQAFFEALDRYEGHVFASHSNPRKFCNTDRHLSDAMIRRLAERDGVMGIVLYNRFLRAGWQKGDARLPFSVVLDAIDYVCQVTGSAAHVGIGSDFDGGFGVASIPAGLDSVMELLKIGAGLAERGYAPADVAAIMHGNMLRKLRQCLP